MVVREIAEGKRKSSICSLILRDLPEWFGVESSIVDYTKQVRTMPFFVVMEREDPIGFLAIKVHNPFTAEISVIGVGKEYHRKKVGTSLLTYAEKFCIAKGYQYLTVKTLDDSVVYKPYEQTRSFYHKMGFLPLEVFPLFWDEENPCLFLVKQLSGSDP